MLLSIQQSAPQVMSYDIGICLSQSAFKEVDFPGFDIDLQQRDEVSGLRRLRVFKVPHTLLIPLLAPKGGVGVRNLVHSESRL